MRIPPYPLRRRKLSRVALKPTLAVIFSKSGGFRAIVGYRRAKSDRIVFLYAFSKNAKANISGKEEAALSLAAGDFLAATDQQVTELLANGAIFEVNGDE